MRHQCSGCLCIPSVSNEEEGEEFEVAWKKLTTGPGMGLAGTAATWCSMQTEIFIAGTHTNQQAICSEYLTPKAANIISDCDIDIDA